MPPLLRQEAMPELTILHTEWSDGWGGQERRILSEMLGMREDGYRMLLACRPASRLGEAARRAGISVFSIPFSGKFDLASIYRLGRLIRDERVDVVNTHSGIDSWVGGLAARLAGVLLVRTRHLNLPLKRNWLNFVHYLPFAVVTCGEAMRQNLIDHGFPAGEVSSIPTGIDFATFRPSHERNETRQLLSLLETAFVVLMVGIIRGVKRHEVGLRAFAEFSQRHPGARLVLAGDGPMRTDMEKLAVALRIQDSVLFLGHRDDVADLLVAADCFLLTSRSEGVPQAITQALGIGLPVVATAVGGVPELVIDGRTGLLIPPESPEIAAQALARIADDSALAARLIAEGKAHAEQHYSQRAMLDATQSLYHRLLGRHS